MAGRKRKTKPTEDMVTPLDNALDALKQKKITLAKGVVGNGVNKGHKYDWDSALTDWLSGKYKTKEISIKYNIPYNQLCQQVCKWTGAGLKQDSSYEHIVGDEETWFEALWKKLDECELKDNEKIFLIYFVHTGDRLTALKKAGYKPSTAAYARQMASHYLAKPKMQKALKILAPSVLDRLEITKQDVVNMMAKLMTTNMGDFIDDYGYKEVEQKSRSGNFTKTVPYIKLKDRDEVDMDMVKSLRIGQSGDIQIELYDKLKGIEFFVRHLKLLQDAGTETVENKLANGLIEIASHLAKKNQ